MPFVITFPVYGKFTSNGLPTANAVNYRDKRKKMIALVIFCLSLLMRNKLISNGKIASKQASKQMTTVII